MMSFRSGSRLARSPPMSSSSLQSPSPCSSASHSRRFSQATCIIPCCVRPFRSTSRARAVHTSYPSHRPSRSNQAAAVAAATTPRQTSYSDKGYIPPPPLSTPSSADDQLLKAHFDLPYSVVSPSTSPSSQSQSPTPTPGLFLFPPLTHPRSLRSLTDRTLIQASAIVHRISSAPSDPTGKELRLVVKNLDRLSDVLCGVIDMCELVRNVHPDRKWVDECEMAYERLCSFMNELNTSTDLYESLRQAVAYPHANPLSSAERKVAQTFLNDFERSGIHLPPAVRARFVQLSDSLLSLGRSFLSSASAGPSSTPLIEIPEPERLLAGMGSQFIDSLRKTKKRGSTSALVTPGSWEAQIIARYAREGEARRLVYIGGIRKDEERIEVLETLLKERAELANVLGKDTWADVVLTDKMAKTPQNVMGFLNSLAAHHKPSAAEDVAALQRLKASSLTGNFFSAGNSAKDASRLPPLHAWDRDFYGEKYATTLSPTSSLPPISPYFSTGTALLGLSRIFSKLYGISFKPSSVAPGEVWHPSVRRLDVVDEIEGTIGVIYCDLFAREGKPASAAHYTVRTSRRVDDDDAAGDGLTEGWDRDYGPGLEVKGDALRGKEGRYQLPIVVLTTDFGTADGDKPALLAWTDVETLFHEVGHAIHSMIGRTEFHNVSGTRCATDFVELPSILMEHFVSSPSVLSKFATHYATGEPLPIPLLQAHLASNRNLAALETHGQILMALVDQKYHSLRHGEGGNNGGGFDSTAIWHKLQSEVGVIQPVEGTAWQTQFGHLYGYGATYYSYLFDRAIAGKVWSTLFDDNHHHHSLSTWKGGSSSSRALSREGGEKLKEKLLKWGGGRDPWVMVGDVVGGAEGEVISGGDEKAMKLVGKWMIK